ncbi:MAG: VWA domain-containing protein, partial [Desulfovibrionales bacterium]
MRKLILLSILALTMLALTSLPTLAQVEYTKKTDNFAVLVDHSASMRWDYQDFGPKIEIAKELVQQMNQEIPDLDYQGGFYTFAPNTRYLGISPYNKARFADAVQGLETDYSRFWRNTPMGKGLQGLADEASGATGRMSVILFTDGGHNTGTSPVAAARDLEESYAGELCLYVVSFAQKESEQDLVNTLGDLTNCSTTVQAETLRNPQAMQNFVEEVFYERREIVTPAVEPMPAPEPEPAP